MNTVFIGGSRRVSHLPAHAKERLNNVIERGFPILIGDANGADKAVQAHLLDRHCEHVTVFCSGETCRNNLGRWKTNHIRVSKDVKGFQFYAAKDREMAHAADFGLMIWDGKSPGTILNVLRLVRAGKKAVLLNAQEKRTITFKTSDDWDAFLSQCTFELRNDFKNRATPEEWLPSLPRRPSPLDVPLAEPRRPDMPFTTDDELAADINAALA